jgi:uncharacterized membrane protein
MANENDELQELRRQISALTARIYALEQAAGVSARRPEPTPSTPAPPPLPSQPAPVSFRPPVVPPAPPARPRADLESKIGAQWLNRIGIVAVLIGVSYFLKYAFDNQWIGPTGRVVIGLLAGIAVVWWSEWFRGRGHRIFSYSLKAVGVGGLYLSLWAAFQLYHLVPANVAFFAMAVVTISTVIMALRQDAEIIAAFALLGGFATPVLLSTGQNRQLELFSYMALLDLGTLALIAARPWKRLLIGSFVSTLILYVGWYGRHYTSEQFTRTLIFATIFFAIFSVAPLISRGKLSGTRYFAGKISTALIVISLCNAVVYFFQLAALFDEFAEKQQQSLLAWSAVGIAAIYLLLSRELRRQSEREGPQSSELMPLLHIAIAIGFLTIAVPLKLDTHWITIGWLVEAAVLLWISQRTDTALLRYLGGGALVLGIARLLVLDNFNTQRLIFNARFATYAVAITVLAGILRYAGRNPEYATVSRVTSVALNALALLGLNYEVRDFFQRRMYTAGSRNTLNFDWRQMVLVRDFTYSALWMCYGAVLMAIGFWRRVAFLRWQALVLIAFTIAKVFIYDLSNLDKGYRIVSFIVLGVLLLAISFVYQRDWLKLSGDDGSPQPPGRTNSASA